jgi:hypothetical protein
LPSSFQERKHQKNIEKEWANKPHIPNSETIKTFHEGDEFFKKVKAGKKVKTFKNADEMFKSLGI